MIPAILRGAAAVASAAAKSKASKEAARKAAEKEAREEAVKGATTSVENGVKVTKYPEVRRVEREQTAGGQSSMPYRSSAETTTPRLSDEWLDLYADGGVVKKNKAPKSKPAMKMADGGYACGYKGSLAGKNMKKGGK